MSVLIKGMEMPENCKDCKLRAYSDDYTLSYCVFNSYLCWASDEYVSDYLLDSCPLSEIPTPHGRLIDADELIGYLHKALADTDVLFLFERIINRQPTIIEAEVSE